MRKNRGWVLGVGIGVAGLVSTPRAEAMPTITQTQPVAGTAVGDSVLVRTQVTSPFVLTSVTAQIGGVSEVMTPLAGGAFRTTLDLSGLPIAPATLTITAMDANGDTATHTAALIHDHPPVLDVLTPAFVVGRPTIALRATCADADIYGCASLAVAVRATGTSGAPTVVATTTSSMLDQTVSLGAYEGKAVDLVFTATDTAGMTVSTTLQGFVESSPKLVVVEEVDGKVLDADATRVLFVNDAGVHLKNRLTGAVTALGAGTPATETTGHLGTTGAIWTHGDWLNGIFTARAEPLRRARGDWAIRQGPSDTAPIHRVDLVTGAVDQVSTIITTYPAQLPFHLADIDAAGTAAWTMFVQPLKYELHTRTVGGPDVKITQSLALSPVDPVIDGTTLFWNSHLSQGRSAILLRTPAGDQIADATLGGNTGPTVPHSAYRANDGWAAYTKVVGGQLTARTRSPGGTDALASSITGTYAIVGLNPSGEIAYDVLTYAPTAVQARYLSAAGAASPSPAVAIGGSVGQMRWVDGAWYELLGRSVLRVGGDGPPGGGVDGGPGGAEAGAPADGGLEGGASHDAQAGPVGDAGALSDAAGGGTPGAGGGTPGAGGGAPGGGAAGAPADLDAVDEGGSAGSSTCALTRGGSSGPPSVVCALGLAALAATSRRLRKRRLAAPRPGERR